MTEEDILYYYQAVGIRKLGNFIPSGFCHVYCGGILHTRSEIQTFDIVSPAGHIKTLSNHAAAVHLYCHAHNVCIDTIQCQLYNPYDFNGYREDQKIENYLPFFIFVIAMTGTPGPGNLTMMTIG